MLKLTKIVFAVFGLSMIASSYAEPVNINAATADEIAASLNGVGSKQAAAIVEYRETNGPFQSLDDITNVKGVGVKTVAKNQDSILFDGTATAAESKPAAPSVQTVNVNLASAQELVVLKGIGPAKAAAIVAYREAHGTFQAIDDLIKVKGIGEKTLAKNRDYIVLQ